MSKELFHATKFCLLTFTSTYYALKAEKILEEHEEHDFVIIPTPRDITSSCGLSIKFFCLDKDKLLNILENEQIEIDKVLDFTKESVNVDSLTKKILGNRQ